MGVILQQPDWGFPRLTTELKVGMALWPSTISFPIAQIGLQILFVLIVAGTALRGELGRFVDVFRTLGKLALLLLPAGIMATRVILVSARSGEYKAVQSSGCVLGGARTGLM